MLRRNYFGIAMLVGVGFVVAGLNSSAQEKDKPAPQSATAEARRDAAMKVYEGVGKHRNQSPESAPTFDYYYQWSVRWMQAERDLGRTNADDIAAAERHLKRMQVKKEIADEWVKQAIAPSYYASAAEFFCLEAEDWLAAARAK